MAKEGDCLTVVGNDAIRTECTSADATHEVLKRLTDVSKISVNDPCEEVPDYTGSYSWSWTTEGTVSIPSTTYDVVLCLSEL